MARFNLFVGYDLNRPGQNYDLVRDEIKKLGIWLQVQESLFYLSTDLPPAAVHSHVGAVMDNTDHLIVINALGCIITEPQQVVDAINKVWFSAAA